jgi:hypothetical protein
MPACARSFALRPLDEPSTLTRMTAQTAAPPAPTTTETPREPMVGVLRALLLAEAAGGLVLAIVLSMAASLVGADQGPDAEVPLQFAAAGAFLLGILAAIASRGARRRRSWSWTLAAMLQVVIAVATGITIFSLEWHLLYLLPFGAAALIMLVLSTSSVRRALGQA